MAELHISPNFTVDDIHKIREYNYELTKDMSKEERNLHYKKRELRAMKAQKQIDAMRAARKTAQQA